MTLRHVGMYKACLEREIHMEMMIKMFNLQMVLMVYLFVGILARKKGIITEGNVKKLIDLILRMLMPCMVFQSFNRELTFDVLRQAFALIVVAFGIGLVSIAIGKVVYRKYPFERRSIMQYATLVNNAGFAGLPMVEGVFGDLGLFYASIAIIPNRIYMWSAGISLFTEASLKQRVKNVMLNPNIIAVGLGLIRAFIGLELPGFLDTALSNIGGIVAPLSMVVVGSMLAEVEWKTVFDREVLLVSVIRLVVLPVLVGIVLKFLPLDQTAAGVSLILTSMPAGTTTALMAGQYGADAKFGSKCVFVTTVLSLITVPLMMLLI